MGFVVLNLWVSLLCFVGFYGVRSTESLGFSVANCAPTMVHCEDKLIIF
jgi:hypothetical protein